MTTDTTTPGAPKLLWTLAKVQAWLDEHATDDIRYAVILASDIVYDYEQQRQLDKARIADLEALLIMPKASGNVSHMRVVDIGVGKSIATFDIEDMSSPELAVARIADLERQLEAERNSARIEFANAAAYADQLQEAQLELDALRSMAGHWERVPESLIQDAMNTPSGRWELREDWEIFRRVPVGEASEQLAPANASE